MQLIKPDTNIDFVGKRTLALAISLLLLAVGFVSLIANGGPNYGIDFAGGTLVQVRFTEATNAADIKKALEGMEIGSLVVQQFGDDANEFMIRMEKSSAELKGLSIDVQKKLTATYGAEKVDVRRTEMVGPQVGSDLRMKGLKAILYAMLGILVYISWRFEFRFAVGAIIALIHDVAITLGVFSLFGKEIDLPIIAAFLAIIGYSLNDTIIVYDRIRENVARYNKETFSFIVNRSINDTLSRTILTSGTTLLVVLALFVLGGGVIHNFAFAMLIGVLIGTYSSVFVASPILIYWEQRKLKKS
jgi:preprotein translocase subunit SecF